MTKNPTNLPKGLKLIRELPTHENGGHVSYECEADVAVWHSKNAPFNDPKRTDFTATNPALEHLLQDIEENGLLQRPVVNREYIVIGNRRFACVNKLNWPTVTVIYRPDANPSLFAGESVSVKPHSRAQRAMAWLVDTNAVTRYYQREFNKAVLSILGFAKSAWNYCQLKEIDGIVTYKDFIRKAVDVQVKYDDQESMKNWIRYEKGIGPLYELIMSGRSLKPHAA